jgi:hypothetical protein
MNKIIFKVKAKKAWKLKDRAIARDAINFVLDWYGIQLDRPLVVTLKRSGEHTIGWSLNLKDKYVVTLSHEYTVKELVKLVIHEITHIKQYVAKELDMEFSEKEGLMVVQAMWKGVSIEIDPSCWNTYNNLPWEIEAQLAEYVIYEDYLKSLCWKA